MNYERLVLYTWLICFAFVGINCTDVHSVLETVPKDERHEFIKYYAQLGYELSKGQNIDQTGQTTIQEYGLPNEFAILLYQYLQTREIVCFEDGTCIDIGDVGVHPKV